MADQQLDGLVQLPKKAADQYDSYDVPMDEIFSDDQFNCRGKIVPIDVVELAQDIKMHKLQQPITVMPFQHPQNPKIKWRIVAGHRRHAAFKVNKSTHIPAMIRTDLDELTARLLNLTENLKREALNIVQEARAIDPFVKKGWHEDTIAVKVGTSRGWVQVRKMILQLPLDVQAEAAAGVLTQEHVRQLYSMRNNPTKMYDTVRLIKERRERGENARLERKKPIKPTEKRERSKAEMEELQDYIQEQVGNNLATRILGWATGFVSSLELHRELKEFFRAQGDTYNIPREITDALYDGKSKPNETHHE